MKDLKVLDRGEANDMACFLRMLLNFAKIIKIKTGEEPKLNTDLAELYIKQLES